MLPDRRAVVFDLDDTLYPYRWYVRSGFAAIAAYLERSRNADAKRTFRILLRATRGTHRGRELQHLMATLRLSDAVLPVLIDLMRGHQPRLRLPRPAATALRRLRQDGWRIGILTNGDTPIQARKVAALRVAAHVDTVVYARQHGCGGGKPEAAPFVEIARRLGVAPPHVVVVGDDERCDMAGAEGAGMSALRCDVWTGARPVPANCSVVDRLAALPAAVRTCLEEASSRHAA
jgi:putative hydrolase of the HAD superfamily